MLLDHARKLGRNAPAAVPGALHAARAGSSANPAGFRSRLGLLSLVEEMHAVCTFPVRLLDALNRSGRIVRIPVMEELAPLAVSMVTRAGQSLTPAGEKLADCIRHRAGIVVAEWAESDTRGQCRGA